MKTNFNLKIGNKEITGIWGIILAIIIAIPVLAIVGVILSLVFSVVGVVVAIALGVAGIALVIGLITLLIPKKWREKLGIRISYDRDPSSKTKPTQTPDGKPIIDVDFKEDK